VFPSRRRFAPDLSPPKQAVDIALQATYGSQAAHAKGIVHRDIKPANLMLIDTESSQTLVRVLDFGIAQWTGKTALTEEGLTVGTASYMAPEQVAGSHVDERADIWSLGVFLYQMLSARLPFEGTSLRETLAAVASPRPVDLSPIREVASAEVVSILRKALEKEPAKRYQTASALIADLERARGVAGSVMPAPTRARRLRQAAGLLGIAGLISVALFTILKRKETSETDVPRIVPFTVYPGYQQDPAISPDGKEIAFVGQGKEGTNPLELYVQLIGSTDPLRLTTVSPGWVDRSPTWNPSATQIAFLCTRAPGQNFMVRSHLDE
jgi:eukaryotic-like serine/threonine-protein kinase